MIVHFWGTRGSLPAGMPAPRVEEKVARALVAAGGREFSDMGEALDFVRSLPFADRATFGGNTACVEVRGGTEPVLCDAGSGLRDYAADVGRMQAPPKSFHLFVSHPHWDHLCGFPFFTPAYIPGNTVTLYGCHEGLEEAFETQQNAPHFPVPLSAMGADIRFVRLTPGETRDIAGFKVTAAAQNHPGDSYGYRFVRDEKTLVYSTDSEHKSEAVNPDYPFLDFIRDADLLIFDAQYSLADAVLEKENWGHSSNLSAVELAVLGGVKKLVLFHHEHTENDRQLTVTLEKTRQYLAIYAPENPLTVDMAYDGLTLPV